MTCIRNVASGATVCLTVACFWSAPPFESVDGAERFPSRSSTVQYGSEANAHAFLSCFTAALLTPIKSTNITKGKVKVVVLNNTHVTYFYYPADSSLFTQAGKDPAAQAPSALD